MERRLLLALAGHALILLAAIKHGSTCFAKTHAGAGLLLPSLKVFTCDGEDVAGDA